MIGFLSLWAKYSAKEMELLAAEKREEKNDDDFYLWTYSRKNSDFVKDT